MQFWNNLLSFQCCYCCVRLDKPIVSHKFKLGFSEIYGICQNCYSAMIEEEKNSLWFTEFQNILREQQSVLADASVMETSLDRQNQHGVSLYNYVLTGLDGKHMGVDAPKGVIPRDNPDTVRRQMNILEREKRKEEDDIIYDVTRRAAEFNLGQVKIRETLLRKYNIRVSNNKIARIIKEIAKENG